MATEISDLDRDGGPAGREEVKARKKICVRIWRCSAQSDTASFVVPVKIPLPLLRLTSKSI